MEVDCTYCLRLEQKDETQTQTVRRMVASKDSSQPEETSDIQEKSTFQVWSEELLRKQTEDCDIAPLIQWKANSETKPSWSEVSSTSPLTKIIPGAV